VIRGGSFSFQCRCSDALQEAQHQASTTLSMLTRFQGRYHAALLLESPVLASLVDFAATLPAHSPLVDVSVALVNLCNTNSPALQQQVSHVTMHMSASTRCLSPMSTL
jgi:hypothetical protein